MSAEITMPAGRPRKPGDFPRHVPRPRVIRATPVHVTMRVLPVTARLRSGRRFRVIRRALVRGGLRFGFRLVHYSVQSNHLHLLGEAEDTHSLSRAMKGIAVRIARGLNTAIGRRGTVIGQRYHLRVVRSPLQAHRCIAYVLNNLRRHAAQRGKRLAADYLDECSSARVFDGWSYRADESCRARDPCPDLPIGVHAPRSRLLSHEWRAFGLLDPAVIPGPFPEREALEVVWLENNAPGRQRTNQ
jgi:REP element-mobilizing transposase RayT